MRVLLTVGIAICLQGLFACERKPTPPRDSTTPPGSGSRDTGGGHGPNDGHAHDQEDGDDHGASHAGVVVDLGTNKIADLTVKATRDSGEIKPGGDAPIDVWITTADGKPAQASAVRFWIGTEDARAFRKARAEIENPEEPNHWHTHVEVPDPMPPESRLWVELEKQGGKKDVTSFPLK
jgi:hypothetical protein